MDRGGLLFPQPDIVNAVIYNYIVVQKLLSPELEKQFLDFHNQRDLVISITVDSIKNEDFFLVELNCESGHLSDVILKHIIKSSTNIWLGNYVKKRNDCIKKVVKKRKVCTVQKNILN